MKRDIEDGVQDFKDSFRKPEPIPFGPDDFEREPKSIFTPTVVAVIVLVVVAVALVIAGVLHG